jgi:hypothetical protein
LERSPLFHGRKCSFEAFRVPRKSQFRSSEQNRQNSAKFLAAAVCFEMFTLPRNGLEWNSESLLLFLFTEWNSELFLLPLKGSEGNFKSLLLFCSTERNSELLSLPLKDSEGNSRSLVKSLFHETEFPSCFVFRGKARNRIPRVFCSAESVLRIRDVYPGSRILIFTHPGSRIPERQG